MSAITKDVPPLEHHFGPKLGLIDNPGAALFVRFCRPGAVFGPAHVERRMGVQLVVHEKAEPVRGGTRCPLCCCAAPEAGK